MKKLLVSTMAVVALLSTGCTKEEVKYGEEAFTYISEESDSHETKEIRFTKVVNGDCWWFIKDDNGNYSKEYVSEYVSNYGMDYDDSYDIYSYGAVYPGE